MTVRPCASSVWVRSSSMVSATPRSARNRGLPTRTSWPATLAAMPLPGMRSEEHTSELQSLMRISYAVFCLKKKNDPHNEVLDKLRHQVGHINHQGISMAPRYIAPDLH